MSQNNTLNNTGNDASIGRLDYKDENELNKSMRYEYYIHYLGIDRRNDRWVPEQFLKIDPDEIHKQEQEISKDEEERNRNNQGQFLFNDEHHGMTEKDIEDFIK